MKTNEIARGIANHLQRFEADLEGVNAVNPATGVRPYEGTSAVAAGPYVRVTYREGVHTTPVVRTTALGYLRWLRAGHVGRHEDYVQSIGLLPHGDVDPDQGSEGS